MDKKQKFGVRKNNLAPDTILKDKYRVGVLLGSGYFGMTYMAFDTVLQQMVAIKEFFPNGLVKRAENGLEVSPVLDADSAFESGKRAFKEEAVRIFGSFDLPGICAVKDFFEANGTSYIVQEYLSGGTLKEYLQQKNNHMISWDECLEMFTPVLEGLNHIHAMGIIHRDISPDNLMFSASGELKLIDFGAAKYHASSEDSLVAKSYYAAPEQYKDTQMIGPWSDLYALCCVMYEVLTGKKPTPALLRMKRDNVQKISEYTVISDKDENAILQGMSLEIQKRYFYSGNLMERFGLDTKDSKLFLGKIRSLWGESWLLSITEKTMDIQEKKRFRLNVRQKRRVLTAFVILAVVFGSISMYLKSNPEIVFDYKLNQARKISERLEEKGCITSKSSEFERVLEAILPYEKEASSYDAQNIKRYDLPEDVLKKLGIASRGKYGQGKFYLDVETVEDIVSHYYDREFEIDYEEYYGSFQKETVNDVEYIYSYASHYHSYEYVRDDGEEGKMTVSFDPVDGRIIYITFEGGIEEGELFLSKVFPYLVPETYFTDDEIKDVLSTTREVFEWRPMLGEEDDSAKKDVYLNLHSKYRLSVYSYASYYSRYVKVTLYPGAERNTY